MKILVAISAAILMVSKGQILTQPPPQVSVISPSSPWLWYPTFSPGSVSLRTDLGSCPDDMIQVKYNVVGIRYRYSIFISTWPL